MKFNYHYPSTTSYITIPVIMLLICSFPIYFAFYAFFLALTDSSGQAGFYFLFGGGMILLSLPFVIWAILHYLKNKHFYSSKPWTGIEIIDNEVISQYFNSWNMIVTRIDLTIVESCWIDSYKRQYFISFKFKNSNQKINIPINRVEYDDQKLIFNIIQTHIK